MNGVTRALGGLGVLLALPLLLAATQGGPDRTPPGAPGIRGPRVTSATSPSFRLSARDNRTPASRMHFRCAFDTPFLKPCPAIVSRPLGVGTHALHAIAVDEAKNTGRVSVFDFAVTQPDSEGRLLALDASDGRELWSVRPPMAGLSTPAAAEGEVVVEGGYDCDLDYGMLAAFDAASGAPRWRDWDQPRACADARPGAAGGVVVMRRGGTLSGLDLGTGRRLWQRRVPPDPFDRPQVDTGSLVLALTGTHLLALDRRSGARRWAASPGDVDGSPATNDSSAFFLRVSGQPESPELELVAVGLARGQVRWDAPLGRAERFFGATAAGGTVVAGGTVTLVAFDAASGRELWRRAQPSALESPPLIAGGILYVVRGRPEGGTLLQALDPRTGALRWEVGRPESSAAVASDGTTTVLATPASALALDPATGDVRWIVTLPGPPAPSLATVAGGRVYVARRGDLLVSG